MKKSILFVVAALMISLTGMAQAQKEGPASAMKPIRKCVDLTAGYVPAKAVQAFKASVSFNNLIFHRFGVYTSVELNGSNDYFSHIIGITGSITRYLYLFAGADVFTDNGLINKGFDCRKTLGVGVYPYKWTVIKVGYSLGVGPTAEIGVRIPLEKKATK